MTSPTLQPRLWPRQALMAVVLAYRYTLKPWLGNACRFEPTCSAYALQALERHGALRGVALSGWRLARCHPWCDGGFDPVPETATGGRPGLFTRLLPAAATAAGPAAPATTARMHGTHGDNGDAVPRDPPSRDLP